MSASDEIITDFAAPVEPEVETTSAMFSSTSDADIGVVERAGPEPSSAAAKFSCNCGIDHSA